MKALSRLKKIFSWLPVAPLFLAAAGCQRFDHWRARSDFKEVCDLATNFARAADEIPVTTQSRLAGAITEVIDSEAARKAFAAAGHLPMSHRYSAVLEAAREVGLENFSCPALKNLLQPGSED